MSHRHKIVGEAGGWTLIALAIAAIVYFLLSKTAKASVSSRFVPTITPDMADKIAMGNLPAYQIAVTDDCRSGFVKYMGVGDISQAWCVLESPRKSNVPIDTVTIDANSDLAGPRTAYEQTMISGGNTLTPPPGLSAPAPLVLLPQNAATRTCDDTGNCANFDSAGNFVGYN